MTRGPKPIPSATKRATGNRGHRPIPADEPDIPAADFDAPAMLTPGAKAHWAYYYPMLSVSRVLKPADKMTLAAFCVNADRFERMEVLIASLEVVKAPKTGTPMQNPYLSISQKAQELMMKFGAELGLSPSSRTRLHVETPKTSDFAAKFLATPRDPEESIQ